LEEADLMKKKITSIENATETNEEIDTLYIITVLLKNKYFIGVFTFITTISSIIYVLVAQPMYESQTVLYPVGKGQASPLAEIANTFGLANRIEDVNLLDVIRSRTIAKNIVNQKYKTLEFKDSVNLIQYWKIDELFPEPEFAIEYAISIVGQIAASKEDKESGVITIKVRMPERQLAADVANNFAKAVTSNLQSEQRNVTIQTRKYIEKRLEEAENRLIDIEEEMIKFKEQNYQLNSPALRAELVRVERRFTLMQNFVTMLSKQRELILLEEAREKSVVNVLDIADVSFKPVTPKKREVVITNTMIAFMFSSLLSFLKEKYLTKDKMNKIFKIILGRK